MKKKYMKKTLITTVAALSLITTTSAQIAPTYAASNKPATVTELKDNIKDAIGTAADKIITAVSKFIDISGHWAESVIELAVKKGYLNGYEDGTFKPDGRVTRAEFIKMVDTALNVPITGSISGSDWYLPYVNAAVNSGYHQWSDFTNGDWNTPMTRKEMARVAVRAASSDQNTDDKKWMYLATKAGLITGMDDTGTLGEDQSTTRAQAVTIIERILSIKEGKTLPTDKRAVSRAEVAWHGTNIYTMLPRYFSVKFQDRFDLSKAQWGSSDGIYHEEVVSFIVVDLDDPSDPFRSEIDGIKYIYPSYRDGREVSKVDDAPKGAYAVFSKVKSVVQGQYPLDLFVNLGGQITMSQIVPEDAVKNKRPDWREYYSSQESTRKILFTKASDNNSSIQWHNDRNLNPYFAKNMPANGGTFYWINAVAIPKGDFFSYDGVNTILQYKPNLGYMKTYGPQGSIVLEKAVPDYSVKNP